LTLQPGETVWQWAARNSGLAAELAVMTSELDAIGRKHPGWYSQTSTMWIRYGPEAEKEFREVYRKHADLVERWKPILEAAQAEYSRDNKLEVNPNGRS